MIDSSCVLYSSMDKGQSRVHRCRLQIGGNVTKWECHFQLFGSLGPTDISDVTKTFLKPFSLYLDPLC